MLDARNYKADTLRLMLVGNKTDLAEQRSKLLPHIRRQVTEAEGQALAKELDMEYFETSAKDGTNVKQMFNKLASLLPGLEGAEIAHHADSKELA